MDSILFLKKQQGKMRLPGEIICPPCRNFAVIPAPSVHKKTPEPPAFFYVMTSLMNNLAAGAVEANHILVGSIDHLPGHFLGSVAIKLRLIA